MIYLELINFGNTCYMDALIRSLVPFGATVSRPPARVGPLTDSLFELLDTLSIASDGAIEVQDTPKNFKTVCKPDNTTQTV